MVEEISGKPIIQALTSLLLAAFSQIYCGNCEEKAVQEDLKYLQFSQGKKRVKLGLRKVAA